VLHRTWKDPPKVMNIIKHQNMNEIGERGARREA